MQRRHRSDGKQGNESLIVESECIHISLLQRKEGASRGARQEDGKNEAEGEKNLASKSEEQKGTKRWRARVDAKGDGKGE